MASLKVEGFVLLKQYTVVVLLTCTSIKQVIQVKRTVAIFTLNKSPQKLTLKYKCNIII